MAQLTSIDPQRREAEELLNAIGAFVGLSQFRASTRRVYQRTLEGLVDEFGGYADVAQITRALLKTHLRGRYGHTSPATYNRHLATISSLLSWCEDQELIVRSPAARIRRRKPRKTRTAERQSRAIALVELEAYWTSPGIPLRERVFVAMAYDTAARASELLGLDIADLDRPNKQAVVIGKGGNGEPVFWSSITARLLPRLIAGRTSGPLFLADLATMPARQLAASDLCPDTGRARLSYRRAAELFKSYSGGYTLHQIRHSRLTHLAEASEGVTLIKAKSRHSSLRTLEPYVNPSEPAATVRDIPRSRRRLTALTIFDPQRASRPRAAFVGGS